MDKKTLMEFGLRALREKTDYSGRTFGSRVYDTLNALKKGLDFKVPSVSNPFAPKPSKQDAVRAALDTAATTPSGRGLLGPKQGYANLGKAKSRGMIPPYYMKPK